MSETTTTPNVNAQPGANAKPETAVVTCTTWTKNVLSQIQENFESNLSQSQDIFVTLAKQEEDTKKSLPDTLSVANNHLKAVASWGLVHLKDTTNGYAQRQFALFLTSLEQAASHLEKALKQHDKNPGTPLEPETK